MITREQALADIALAAKATGLDQLSHGEELYARTRTALREYAKQLIEAMELLEKVLSPCSHCQSTGEVTVVAIGGKYNFKVVDCPACIVPMRAHVAAYHAREKPE